MAPNLKSLVSRFNQKVGPSTPSAFAKAPEGKLFPKTDPLIDGEECLHDCEDCTIKLPAKFKIDESDALYGQVKGWSTHLIVATGKTDWVRDVADEPGSIMEAVGKGSVHPDNGRLMLSASDMPIPNNLQNPSATRVLLLPSFTYIDNVTQASVPELIKHHVNTGPTNTTPLPPTQRNTSLATNGATIPTPPLSPHLQLRPRSCPHQYLILLCSQRTRDARCGQSAPLLKREFERHLRPLGLYRDAFDERPGGVGIHFISHVGGHKYSANCFVYRRAGALGTSSPLAAVALDEAGDVDANGAGEEGYTQHNGATITAGQASGGPVKDADDFIDDGGAAQCIWLARVRPEDCENIVRYTVLQGKVVKPERQLRGGFDRGKGLVSW